MKRTKLILSYIALSIILVILSGSIWFVLFYWLQIDPMFTRLVSLILGFAVFILTFWVLAKQIELEKRASQDVLLMIMTIVPMLHITVSGLFFKDYLEYRGHSIVELTNPEEIDTKPKSVFYTINNYHLNVADWEMQTVNYNDTEMQVFLVIPIDRIDTGGVVSTCHAWYGKLYKKDIYDSHNIQGEFRKFIENEVLPNLDNEDFGRFEYLERPYQDQKKYFLKAAEKSSRFDFQHSNILLPVEEDLAKTRIQKLQAFLICYAVGLAIFFIAVFLFFKPTPRR